MILIPENKYKAILDACVLARMPICDTLLRVATEGMYQPFWSKEILREVGAYLSKRGYSQQQVNHRLTKMKEAFPEACVCLPDGFTKGFECIPDENDKHVLAAAVKVKAHVIVTANTKDFSAECLKQYELLSHTPDTFLLHQFHLNRRAVLNALDRQAVAIGEDRGKLI